MANSSLKSLRLVLWGMVAVFVLVLGVYALLQKQQGSGTSGTLPDLAGASVLGKGDYTLQTTDGQPFTQATLTGKPSAIFFGYTHCPDVCPTTLGDIAGWEEQLGDEAKDLRFFFMTVDPERDTADVLKDYVGFVPGVVGVTGSPEEVQKATKAFRVYARKGAADGDAYTVDHSSAVMLFDKNGQYAGIIGYQEGDERALAALRRLLAA